MIERLAKQTRSEPPGAGNGLPLSYSVLVWEGSDAFVRGSRRLLMVFALRSIVDFALDRHDINAVTRPDVSTSFHLILSVTGEELAL